MAINKGKLYCRLAYRACLIFMVLFTGKYLAYFIMWTPRQSLVLANCDTIISWSRICKCIQLYIKFYKEMGVIYHIRQNHVPKLISGAPNIILSDLKISLWPVYIYFLMVSSHLSPQTQSKLSCCIADILVWRVARQCGAVISE